MGVHFYTIKFLCIIFFGHVHMRTKIFMSCAHVHTGGEHKKKPGINLRESLINSRLVFPMTFPDE